MPIPESQLQTWAKQGAVTTAKTTHASIRNALEAYEWPAGTMYEVYLQGSYKNSTNIRGDSDVDIVAQLNFTFHYDIDGLSDPDRSLFLSTYSRVAYCWDDFHADILNALRDYYGASSVSVGDKALKVAGRSGRLDADVIPCLQYRKYRYFHGVNACDYVEGVVFYTGRERRRVINYPKIHYRNGAAKSEQTNRRYKPSVRMFKNARTYLVDHGMLSADTAPSYFLECLLFNVPDEEFASSFQTTFLNMPHWFVKAVESPHDIMCQNGQLELFGDTLEQWSIDKAIELLRALLGLWSSWK